MSTESDDDVSANVKNQLYRWSVLWYPPLDDPVNAHTFVKSALDAINAKYIFQLERGSKNGKLHYQCFINLKDKKRYRGDLVKTLNALGMTKLTARNVKPCTQYGHHALANYCMKEDTRVAGPWADRIIYLARDLCCMANPKPFQQKILDSIQTEPDDRTINWVYNPEGNGGKSKLAKYIEHYKLGITVEFGTPQQIKSALIVEGPQRAYLVDIPRTIGKAESVNDVINVLEHLKNGLVKSYMYGKAAKMFMEPPHVWVFSNMLPDRTRLSQDRWQIWQLSTFDTLYRI